MADARVWFALVIRETWDHGAPPAHAVELQEQVSAILDDYAPIAIEDLQPQPLPPGGLWDPTYPPPPDPPLAPLAWRVFFANVEDRSGAARALRAAFPALALSREDVDDEDWAARSQQQLTAITAGHIIVAPPWDCPAAIPPGHTLVVIEPSRGFGTGHHASTRLCLRALSTIDVRGLRVLDLGTGSGVLAIAAALRGAGHVVGVDLDPDAIAAARESQALNPAAGAVEWLIADYRESPLPPELAGDWDLVLANLTGGMLRSSAERIRELMGLTGQLIASGFDESERDAVLDALEVRPDHILSEETWIGLVARR